MKNLITFTLGFFPFFLTAEEFATGVVFEDLNRNEVRDSGEKRHSRCRGVRRVQRRGDRCGRALAFARGGGRHLLRSQAERLDGPANQGQAPEIPLRQQTKGFPPRHPACWRGADRTFAQVD